MIRYLFALLLFCGIVPAHAQTGAALPSGYLSVSGNQIQSNLGVNVRLACASFRGAPNDGTMAAIRTMGQFNCIRIDWRDAYTAGAVPTFSDPFTSLSLHQTWQTGDKWEIGASFDNGIGQGGPFLGDFGSQWWVNPFNSNTSFTSCGINCYAGGIYQINPSGTIELGLTTIPSSMQSYINTTSQCNGTCSGAGGNLSYLGGLLNNQNTNTQQFGDYRLTVAVDKLAGFDFQWDIESYNGTTNTNNPPEIDFEIYTDSGNVMHTILSIAGGSTLYNVTSPGFDPSVSHTYELNWQSDNITFYVDGTQQGQVSTNSQPAVYLSGNPMFSYLLSAANYRSGTNPATGSLPVYAHVSAFNVYQTQPNGGSAPSGCNSLTQIDGCVANATSAGLAVILNHIGNEIPAGANNPCIGRQQNGLWFDNDPSIGVTDDGCGDGGNYTYTAFKADTVALLQRYAGNSTVIGYQFHNDPIVLANSGGGGSGQFTVSGGKLLGPNGSPVDLLGVDTYTDNGFAGGCNPGNNTCPAFELPVTMTDTVNCTPFLNFYPKVAFVRFMAGVASPTGSFPGALPTAAQLRPYITCLTNKHIVVALQYINYGFSLNSSPDSEGQTLTSIESWYASLAADQKNNPYFWIATQNEPAGTTTDFNNMISGLYSAIRGAGNTAPIPITEYGGWQMTGWLNESTITGMTNVLFDFHAYPWQYCPVGSSGGSCATDPGTSVTDANLTNLAVNDTASFTSADGVIPIMIMETGNNTTCNGSPDPSYPSLFNSDANAQARISSRFAGVGYFYHNFASNTCGFTQGNFDADSPVSFTTSGTTIENYIAAGNGPVPSGGSGTPAVNWAGGGDTDIQAACSDVGTAVNAVNPGTIEFCPGPINNSATLLNGVAKP